MVNKRGSVALALIAFGALAGGWGGSTADAATMDTLLSGASFTVGNATYSNFVYTGETAASDVTVTASTSGNVSTITFGRTTGTWVPGDGSSIINYLVTFATPVTSIGLDFTGTYSGDAFPGVTESVLDGVTGVNYTNPNLWVVTGQGISIFHDSLTFATPVTSLNILKSIDIGSDTGTATIGSVDNTYSSSVPEPASLSLLGLGAMVLIVGGVRRLEFVSRILIRWQQ